MDDDEVGVAAHHLQCRGQRLEGLGQLGRVLVVLVQPTRERKSEKSGTANERAKEMRLGVGVGGGGWPVPLGHFVEGDQTGRSEHAGLAHAACRTKRRFEKFR